jgi:hypothetical protein
MKREQIPVYVIAAIAFLVQIATANRYGYFGDELYYLACAKHLAWGYVDQPPMVVFLTWLIVHTLGTSLLAIHFVPALCGAARILLTAAIARELGGGRFAQTLAALCSAVALVFLAVDHIWSMNTFEPLIWGGCALIVARVINTGDQRLWLAFGALAGLGLETKYSIGVFGAAVVCALLLTRERVAFARPWIWMGGAIAVLIFLPNLIWNVQHHWPFAELMHNINESGRDVKLPPPQFLLQQFLVMMPLTAPVTLAGVWWLFTNKRYRALGWTFALTFLFFMVMRAKNYYVAPAYPIAFAAGGIAFERWLGSRTWAKAVMVSVLTITTAILLPYVVPILSPEDFLYWESVVPFKPAETERNHRAVLPHVFAWRFGWPEMVEATAHVYNSLPPAERARTAIFANDFGEGGAIDLLGVKYGLPQAIGGHQNFWLWGPQGYDGSTVIILGDNLEGASKWFRECSVAATVNNRWSARWEQGPVLLCRGMKFDLRTAWPKLKKWD